MTTHREISTGCWTCRIRRKKCDNVVPVCRGCEALEISCYYEKSKPEWMDNGKRQQEMAERIKSEIKSKAHRRRGRRKLQIIARDIGFDDSSGLDHILQSSASSTTVSRPSPCTSSSLSNNGCVNNDHTDSEPASEEILSSVNPFPSTISSDERIPSLNFSGDRSHQQDLSTSIVQAASLPDLSFPTKLELSFIMAYLDYVFPVSYPFYRPIILEGARTWLLSSFLGNKCLYHIAISLTSYFFSVVQVNPGSAHQLCSSYTWEALSDQTELALKKARSDLHEVSRNGVQENVLESANLIESVVHLLSVEVMLGSDENWQMHLDAADLLFQQLLDSKSKEEPCSAFSHILDLLSDLTSKRTPDAPLWSPDQAAFRFFSAMLIFNDIIASTSLERSPNLREYYYPLLGEDLDSELEPSLQLADVLGCQNWVLQAIGDIAALGAWKKSMKQVNQLSVTELVRRGSVIDQLLHDGLKYLDASAPRQVQRKYTTQLDALSSHPPCSPDTINTITRIWALSARSYLLTTISGWQLANTELRANIAQTISLFCDLAASPMWTRTLAWPLCVTGCLCNVGEEVLLRQLFSQMGGLQNFGTLRQALSIMEYVWCNRAQLDNETWDLAACLACLGHRVMLV